MVPYKVNTLNLVVGALHPLAGFFLVDARGVCQGPESQDRMVSGSNLSAQFSAPGVLGANRGLQGSRGLQGPGASRGLTGPLLRANFGVGRRGIDQIFALQT